MDNLEHTKLGNREVAREGSGCLGPFTATKNEGLAVMSMKWTKRLVITALTTSLSGVGIASAQTLGERDDRDINRDRYGQQDDRNRVDRRDGEKVEYVRYGRDYKRDRRDKRGWGRDHGRHRGWNKRKHDRRKKYEKRHDRHRRDRDYGRRYGRR
jgi:hypothetical protein